MALGLFNPSIASANLGDQIIIDAVVRHLSSLFPEEHLIHLPTQEVIGKISMRHAMQARLRIVGGTNLLSSTMLRYRQWQIGLAETLWLNDVILMGVGWWQYQCDPDFYTRSVLRRILSRTRLHSVRDTYTLQRLASVGLTNVVNTGCPTMWELTPEHCEAIPREKSRNVVFTLTDYHQDPHNDLQLVRLLQDRYERVFFWPQGAGDVKYLKSLNLPPVELIPPSLSSYDAVLTKPNSLDFVGTRLHGGVRALQFKRRALIVAVDNRVREISKDTGLPSTDRKEITKIRDWIENPTTIALKLNWTEIDRWKLELSQSVPTGNASKHSM